MRAVIGNYEMGCLESMELTMETMSSFMCTGTPKEIYDAWVDMRVELASVIGSLRRQEARIDRELLEQEVAPEVEAAGVAL